jgi:photosystem II stability/assembly factor-like uncharacterized protein
LAALRWLQLGFIAAAVLLAAPTPSSLANQTGQNEDWARLGPQGPGSITSIAVAPGWPTERMMLAVRDDALIRTRDGALTWERVPPPATIRDGHVHFLGLLPTVQGVPTAYLLVQDPSAQSTNPWRLLRSTDGGTSWSIALSGPRVNRPPRVVFSPAYARDGVAFLLAGGELWRTRNAGVNWQQLSPRSGQRVQQVVLSPEFGADQTVFLAVAVADRPTGSTSADDRASDHVDSAGVMVSNNGGDTWTALTTGLRLGEDPYQNVYDLAISPTYRQDGTLFAYAAGPILHADPQVALQRAVWNGRLFRSTDRGQSWEALAPLVPAQNHAQVALFMSPAFAQDGLAFAAVDNASRHQRALAARCSLQTTEAWIGAWRLRRCPTTSASRSARLEAVALSFRFSCVGEVNGRRPRAASGSACSSACATARPSDRRCPTRSA